MRDKKYPEVGSSITPVVEKEFPVESEMAGL
jgi:hypothetical protein